MRLRHNTFLQGSAQERLIQIGNKSSILNVIIERFTRNLVCVLFSPRSAQVSLIHLDLAVSMCLHSEGAGRLRQFRVFFFFVKGWSRVMIYQAPSINFSNTNDGHESCCTLTAPFLTSVDLCIHLEWLIC